MPKTVPTKPYDWTYTTMYTGHESRANALTKWQSADPDNLTHAIPIAELTRQDPILFYAEIPLFEDELHDNGSSHLLVRIVRVSRLPLLNIALMSWYHSVLCRHACLFCVVSHFASTRSSSGRMTRDYTTRFHHRHHP